MQQKIESYTALICQITIKEFLAKQQLDMLQSEISV